MAFSHEWEHKVYQKGVQNSVWPWTDLVSHVMRYARPDRENFRVLELGFGAGANIPFILSLGVDYYGTEGSPTAVKHAQERFVDPRFHAICCDFTEAIEFPGNFDLIIDRSSLTHNGTAAIRRCLSHLRSRMNPGAKFIGIDWFSVQHAGFSKGIPEEDYYTRTGFTEGQFRDVGRVHFSDEAHLRELFSAFDFLHMEHKIIDECIPASGHRFASYNFVCSPR